MSYDGGLEVKIKNKKLGEVLDEFAERGFFPEEKVQRWREKPAENEWGEPIRPNIKYTLYYQYLDCAYVSGCPKDIKEVSEYIIDLIYIYEEEISVENRRELEKRLGEEDIVKGYKLVNWRYFHPDSGDLEEFTYRK